MHGTDGQRFKKRNVFLNVCLTDPLAFRESDENAVGYFKRPDLRNNDVGFLNPLQNRL